MNLANRTMRPVTPSDLPKCQAGKLKAYYHVAPNDYFEAKLVSVRGAGEDDGPFRYNTAMWLVSYSTYDTVQWGNERIVVDVTPEKRYAVWDKKKERFLWDGAAWGDKTQTQVRADMATNSVVVEFDYPGDQE